VEGKYEGGNGCWSGGGISSRARRAFLIASSTALKLVGDCSAPRAFPRDLRDKRMSPR
jgi:hypothetical protein